ncbi:MAG: cytochrome-c peroxidase [Chlorobi bacterium]|nr:cytochrome-c peroxidase [Chlorobiota bacterium]
MKTFFKLLLFFVFGLLVLIACKKDTAKEEPSGEVFDPTPYEIIKPTGFPDIIIPDDNPMTVEGVQLGRMLYYDKILSGDNTQSCASCHAPEFSFTDNGKQFSEGIDGSIGNRNSPSVINTAWMPSFFWDGRAATVEDQALGPVPNPVEMNLPWPEAMQKLNAHPDYPDLFFKAFGTREIDSMLVAKAIAQFERTMISSNSKWDRYLRNEAVLTQAESQGFEIFFSEIGDCFHCHTTILFTDNLFHNNGMDAAFTDLGLGEISGNANDIGKFKTPTLRNIEFTAPFMHDGRFETIEDVVDFYSEGVVWSETIDPLMKKVGQGGLHLTDDQKENLIAFLKTLTDESYIENPDFSDPFEE